MSAPETGTYSKGHITSKKIEAACKAFRLCKLKDADAETVVDRTASDYLEGYGQYLDPVTTAQYDSGDGIANVDVRKLIPGDEVPMIAHAAIAAVKTQLGLAASGRVVALVENATHSTVYRIGYSMEIATAQDDQIKVHYEPGFIQY